jgi:transposase
LSLPKRLDISLSAEQQAQLRHTRDHHEKAYMREKAAGILKMVVDGLPASTVAKHGLLKPRDEETVASWLHRYEQHGLAGLLVQAGRGRKPAFSPCRPGTRT